MGIGRDGDLVIETQSFFTSSSSAIPRIKVVCDITVGNLRNHKRNQMRNKVYIPQVKFKLEIKFKHTENSQYTENTYVCVCLCWLFAYLYTHIHTTDMHKEPVYY